MDETRSIRLCQGALADLPAQVLRPTFDRGSLSPGIVHIGVGNFHRAHLSWYMQQLMQRGEALDWAIIGAGVRDFDAKQREKLMRQDFLTTLAELDPNRMQLEVVGSMIDYVQVDSTNGALIKTLARPDIRIVSLTITEGGYFVDPKTSQFDFNHPAIKADARNPTTPKTAFGAIVAALKIRRKTGLGPFTCLSCDNLQGNGDVLRTAVVTLAQLSDPDLAEWIAEHCPFPNSMVDCIVPATGPEEVALVRKLGIEDAVPVTHENFRQWVIEDKFCSGRPEWDKVGATFTDDVKKYEAMKIRILNGGHQVIAGAGELLSLETISACMAHPKIDALLDKVVMDEIAPHVDPVPDMPPDQYLQLIKGRFLNPKIVDRTRRVASNGTTYHPAFIFPSIRDGLRGGHPVEGLALVEAMWARREQGQREDGSDIAPSDPNWEALKRRAEDARTDPQAWLVPDLYGDLATDPRFVDAFAGWLKMIWSDGVEASIDAYVDGSGT